LYSAIGATDGGGACIIVVAAVTPPVYGDVIDPPLIAWIVPPVVGIIEAPASCPGGALILSLAFL
jgi:hypothetical protein